MFVDLGWLSEGDGAGGREVFNGHKEAQKFLGYDAPLRAPKGARRL